MRLPDSTSRRLMELALRTLSVALLGWLLWTSLSEPDRVPTRAHADAEALATRLREWTVGDTPDTLHITLDTVPDRTRRDWLVALRRTGAVATWSSNSIPPIALELQARHGGRGSARAFVAAPTDSVVTLADAAGVLDTARVGSVGAIFTVRSLSPPASAVVGRQAARGVPSDSLLTRRVLVVARAGWEAKFTVAALEEDGWAVDARLRVSPDVQVTQGSVRTLDTAHYAAVVALDSASGASLPGIAKYVRDGGGIVMVGEAARARALSALAPARLGGRLRPATVSFAAVVPRHALPLFPLVRLRQGALVLEARERQVAVAARRLVAGRVVQVGYDETWRWRLAGGSAAPAAHRAWWSAVVASAAYRAVLPRGQTGETSAAPLSELVSVWGPPVRAPSTRPTADQSAHGPSGWLLALLLASLLTEWLSRRLRGAP